MMIKKCQECGKEFEGYNHAKYCPECRKIRHNKQKNRNKRKVRINNEHNKLLDKEDEKYLQRLHDRIIYDPKKEYIPHMDEWYNENIGDRKNNIYSMKHDDETWYEYHQKLKKLKRRYGL